MAPRLHIAVSDRPGQDVEAPPYHSVRYACPFSCLRYSGCLEICAARLSTEALGQRPELHVEHIGQQAAVTNPLHLTLHRGRRQHRIQQRQLLLDALLLRDQIIAHPGSRGQDFPCR